MSRSTFRNLIKEISPQWLRGTWGERYLYTFGLTLDSYWEMGEQAVKARMPGYGTPTALSYSGRDRVIVRGFAESDENFAKRLRRWLLDWRGAGSPWSLMMQLRGYLTPYAVMLRTVDAGGNWYTIHADGTRDVKLQAGNWDWDSVLYPAEPVRWSRFWVLIYPLSTGLWTKEGQYGHGEKWGTGINGTLGTSATKEQTRSIREIVRAWKPLGTTCVHIIIPFDATSFDPAAAGGPPMPDGTWGTWGKYSGGGAKQPARLATARYWTGTGNESPYSGG